MVWQRYTDYGQNLVLNTLFGKTDVMPDTLYLAQITEQPTVASTGLTIQEPSDVNYERLAIDNSAAGTFWAVASAQLKANAEGLTHVAAATDWETVLYYGICDALVGGNLILYGEYGDPFIILATHTLFLNPSDIGIQAVGPTQIAS